MLLGLKRVLPPRPNLSTTIRSLSHSPPPPPPPPPPAPVPRADPTTAAVLRQYRDGKFHSLLRSSISFPSFLLAAAQNLAFPSPSPSPSSISRQIPLTDLSASLLNGSLRVGSLTVNLSPSRLKGDPLVLPNLTLKVVIEAIRIALDVIYGQRLATFAYGGRAGLGRHTAVRYLKSSVENPSWWFKIAFRRQPFDLRHLCKLTAVMEQKIEDPELFALMEDLFKSGAVAIEIGGLDFGKGLPQESGLNSILVNIFFDGLDRVIQEIRMNVHRENPRLKEEDEQNSSSRVFNKPVRVYAVRYLDEILVITSGSKMFTMNVKDRILKYIERELELKVDNWRSSIHSAVSEMMEFMGMELQAVPPSVLHPPMSEKAIRAKKKYLKRKATKAAEMKNAHETVRKKLGMKILNNVFKKMKRGGEFKFDFQIESEVGEIFREWRQEVVAEFFKSREDCLSWHRMLSSGDFLSLKRVRDQLPAELVDAFDRFQEKVDKYFLPVRASRVIEEGSSNEEEEEERRYAKRTVEDLMKLHMRVNAPMEHVRKAVKLAGFTNAMGRPRPIKLLLCLDDADIVKWYAGVGRRWLEYFCCCRNFRMVKTVVNYHLRFSCFLTLAEKHESTKREAIHHFTKDLKVNDGNGVEQVYFPSEREIRMMGDKILSDPKPADGSLSLMLVRLAFNEPSCSCLVHFCEENDVILYRVRLLQNRLNVDPLNEDKWVRGMGAIHEALNKKCLPLCSQHSSDLLLGRITLQDIDCTSFLNVE